MPTITEKDITVPADVPKSKREEYTRNCLTATRNTGRLMLFAGDQKMEHMNDDFHGTADIGTIPADDGDPEHLFRIASRATIGVFASQFGLISRYGPSYPNVPYLIKMNSKTHLDKGTSREPDSRALIDFESILRLKENGLKIMGIGYTIYPGSSFEARQFAEAGRLIAKAHEHGMIAVVWSYLRGAGVKDEKDPHLVAGSAGVAATLGADFVKVKYPKKEGVSSAEAFKEAVRAAGRTKVVCEGGSSTDVASFLKRLHEQIHISGCVGNATGRNIHQKPLEEAIRMADAISAVTLGDRDVDFAVRVAEGRERFSL